MLYVDMNGVIVLAMAWRGQSICVAYKKEYTLLGIDFGEVTDAPVPLEGGVPAIQLISERELLLSANNDLGIFINYKVSHMTHFLLVVI